MNFDAQDILEVNRALLKLAAAQAEPDPAILVSVATWGRGANPEIDKSLTALPGGVGVQRICGRSSAARRSLGDLAQGSPAGSVRTSGLSGIAGVRRGL